MNGTWDPAVLRAMYDAGFTAGLAEDRRRRNHAARIRRIPNNVLSIVGRLQQRASEMVEIEPTAIGESQW